MINRFNYTDRQKIPRRQVRLSWVEEPGEPLRFSGTVDLGLKRPLDPAALVAVEAYIGPLVMRFPYGTVGFPEPATETALTEFAPGLKPHFRVKVIAPGPDRLLLAWANGITPLAPDEVKSGKRSILPVELVELGPLVWKLRVEGNEFRLQLNASIREPRDIAIMAREADFVALVYPAVIRQILEHLLLGPESESVEEDHDWLIYSEQLAQRSAPSRDGESDPTDDTAFQDDVGTWIQDVIQGFCQQHHAAERFVEFKREADESNG